MWKWHPGDKEPSISIKQKLYCPATPSNHYWTIQYPDKAPPWAKYELVEDETPPLTPEQHSQLKGKMMILECMYREEKAILDNLLKLCPMNMIALETFTDRRAIAYNDFNSTRRLIYTHSIESLLQVEITLDYNQNRGYSAWVNIDVGDYSANLASTTLPIRDGVIEEAPLKEFLMNNPLITMGQTIAQLI
jgi:hypothetical protein